MDCEDIDLALKKEKENKTLPALPTTFYKDAEEYLRKGEEDLKKYNSRSVEARMISEELDTSIKRLKIVFKSRTNKILMMISQMSVLDPYVKTTIHKDYNKLLPEEKRVYDIIAQTLEAMRCEVLDPVISPGSPKAIWPEVINYSNKQLNSISENKFLEEIQIKEIVPTEKDESPKKDVSSDHSSNTIQEVKENKNEYMLVRILKGIPTFVGTDSRNYSVKAEDIVTLPIINAQLLIKKNLAQQINSF
ncbi:hypothetical protein FXV91_17240 [Methanosarcina sp. DH2]|uniref:DNA replication complex subunit Gins51 n=1 Tax=Methanosarcina sp. DH2 TaxID=2605639 RepID=UPI001E3C6B3E|nr:hypothetical protein [Methanosarcina sp. DH2]MCC4771845.1 hypothetical protein [Methanosarcina sp. DH2]